MKKYLLPVMILLFLSCSNSDESTNNSGIDCNLADISCGDAIRLSFIKNGQGIFDQNPETEVTFLQNNKSLELSISYKANEVTAFLKSDNPITVKVDDQELNLQLSSTSQFSECCGSVIVINNITVDGSTVCNDGECDNVIEINLD